MKGIQGIGTEGKGIYTTGHLREVSLTTSLMELIGSVREVVEGKYPDEERLVTFIVYRLLGGEGLPVEGDYVSVHRRKDPPVSQ